MKQIDAGVNPLAMDAMPSGLGQMGIKELQEAVAGLKQTSGSAQQAMLKRAEEELASRTKFQELGRRR